MRLLVSGSQGFVGGDFGRCAVASGHTVLGISRSSNPEIGWPGAHVQADVAHSDLMEMIREFRPDVVFHGAGSASVGASFTDPVADHRAALGTWSNVLDAIRRSGLRPLVLFPSSAAVYGNPAQLPVSESAPVNPLSPYGFHKSACEWMAREYSTCFGLRVIIGRLFSIYGMRQRRLLAWELYHQFVGPAPEVWLEGTGAESRDYLSVEDVASAFLALAEKYAHPSRGENYFLANIGRGVEVPVLDLARLIGDITGSSKQVFCRGNARPGDPGRWCADISLLGRILPTWQPKPLEVSLTHCIAGWRRGGAKYGD